MILKFWLFKHRGGGPGAVPKKIYFGYFKFFVLGCVVLKTMCFVS